MFSTRTWTTRNRWHLVTLTVAVGMAGPQIPSHQGRRNSRSVVAAVPSVLLLPHVLTGGHPSCAGDNRIVPGACGRAVAECTAVRPFACVLWGMNGVSSHRSTTLATRGRMLLALCTCCGVSRSRAATCACSCSFLSRTSTWSHRGRHGGEEPWGDMRYAIVGKAGPRSKALNLVVCRRHSRPSGACSTRGGDSSSGASSRRWLRYCSCLVQTHLKPCCADVVSARYRWRCWVPSCLGSSLCSRCSFWMGVR